MLLNATRMLWGEYISPGEVAMCPMVEIGSAPFISHPKVETGILMTRICFEYQDVATL